MGLWLWFFWIPVFLLAGGPNQRNADDYYGMALQAYLLGDFDQAFSMDSKSLELEPSHPKANALFSVLTSEMGWTPKTEIWIGGKSRVIRKRKDVQTQGISQRPITAILGLGKLQELESRIQIVSFLNSVDSQEKYRVMIAGQTQNLNRLDEIVGKSDDRDAANQRRFGENEKGFGVLYLLSLLALMASGAAFWVNWKTRKSLTRRPLAPVIHLEEGEKVIKFNQG